jgi:hypothetical protein
LNTSFSSQTRLGNKVDSGMVFKVDKSTGKIYYYTINGITQDVHDTYLSTEFNGNTQHQCCLRKKKV